jgi:predicted component of type VI protein secretion system
LVDGVAPSALFQMSSYRLKVQHMRYPLRLGETLLGRSPYCSIVLSGSEVSRQHAVLRITRDGAHIEDLGSRNGTWLNGRRITEAETVLPSDQLDIGGHVLEVEVETRDERSQRESQAITGEYPLQTEPYEAFEELTTPGQVPEHRHTPDPGGSRPES